MTVPVAAYLDQTDPKTKSRDFPIQGKQCRIFNPKPQPDENVTWTGTHVGEFMNDQRHGTGIYTNIDGDTYEGEWADGKPEGFGKAVFEGDKIYEGLWSPGCFDEGNRRVWIFSSDEDCTLWRAGVAIWRHAAYIAVNIAAASLAQRDPHRVARRAVSPSF